MDRLLILPWLSLLMLIVGTGALLVHKIQRPLSFALAGSILLKVLSLAFYLSWDLLTRLEFIYLPQFRSLTLLFRINGLVFVLLVLFLSLRSMPGLSRKILIVSTLFLGMDLFIIYTGTYINMPHNLTSILYSQLLYTAGAALYCIGCFCASGELEKKPTN